MQGMSLYGAFFCCVSALGADQCGASYRFTCPKVLVYGTVVYRHTRSRLSCIRLSSGDEYYLLCCEEASTSRGQIVRGSMIGSTIPVFLPLNSLQL